MGAVRLASLWALALHTITDAAGANQGQRRSMTLVRGHVALSRGSPASGARARALAALGEGDAALGELSEGDAAPPRQTRARRAAQVSDHGRFRSSRGVVHSGSLRIAGGHHIVKLGGKGFLLHHLICTAWHGPPPTPEHTRVHHKDLDASNHTPDNLEWATPMESNQHSHDNPNRKSSARAKFKPVCGRKAGTQDEWTHFESCAAAARELGPGFHSFSISAVASGRRTHAGGWTFEFTQQYEEIDGEQWRTVVLDGVESGAQVSDRGRFRDTRGLVKDAVGRGSRAAQGEWQVGVNGTQYLFHRLACTAWHGSPPTPEHTYVHHKDGDASNNTPDNLEWVTPGESVQNSYDHRRKETAAQMNDALQLFQTGITLVFLNNNSSGNNKATPLCFIIIIIIIIIKYHLCEYFILLRLITTTATTVSYYIVNFINHLTSTTLATALLTDV
jgi:hypothetical protein